MPALSTAAIVLRAVNYGEADRVVTLFGREIGRVSALARSARKSQRRFAGGLGLGAVGVAALRERPGAEMLTLESFDATGATHVALGTDVARLAHASYAAELVTKLCAPRQAEPAVYDWLAEMLERLAAGTATRRTAAGLRDGALAGPGLAAGRRPLRGMRDASIRRRHSGGIRTAAAPSAPVARAAGRPIAPATRAALVRLERLSLAEADAVSLPGDVNRGCREALSEIINQHISGPLKSLEFIAKLSQSRERSLTRCPPRRRPPWASATSP